MQIEDSIYFYTKFQTMIVINYLKPNIVVYADELLSGSIRVLDQDNLQLLQKHFDNKDLVQLALKGNPNQVKIIVQTTKQTLTKTINLNHKSS